MNPAEWLVRTALRVPTAPALLSGTTELADYRELARGAAALGAGLTARHGIGPGDRVALFMGNCPEYLEALYGIWFAGAAVLPINAKLHPRDPGAGMHGLRRPCERRGDGQVNLPGLGRDGDHRAAGSGAGCRWR